MSKLFMTEKSPRPALTRDDAGELVASVHPETGEQQYQIAGLVENIRATPDKYIVKTGPNAGEEREWYSCKITVNLGGKVVESQSARINGSQIENVQSGGTYWFTISEGVTKDGELTTNYVTGGLPVENLNSTEGIDFIKRMFANAEAGVNPNAAVAGK